jgi:hypothetical protein
MIEDKGGHLAKALCPIVVTLSGIVTDTSALHWLKQPSHISVTPGGISNEMTLSLSPSNLKMIEGGGETFTFFVFGCCVEEDDMIYIYIVTREKSVARRRRRGEIK